MEPLSGPDDVVGDRRAIRGRRGRRPRRWERAAYEELLVINHARVDQGVSRQRVMRCGVEPGMRSISQRASMSVLV